MDLILRSSGECLSSALYLKYLTLKSPTKIGQSGFKSLKLKNRKSKQGLLKLRG